MIFLFDHPDQREKMAKAGLERVNSIFNWSKAASEMMEVYREAIDGYRRSA
jgi:glycosyltransferase involved in cell wall biosynthesis